MNIAKRTRAVLSLVPFWIKSKSNSALATPEEIADFAFGYPGVFPMQVRSELIEFSRTIIQSPPKAFLEIGTRNGGTFFVLCRLADPSAVAISLDLPGGRFGGGYTIFQVPILRHMRQSHQTVHLVRSNSHLDPTLQRISKVLGDRRLDLLFIDGDHTYEGVKRDFEMYSPLVKTGGIIAFHDIVQVSEPGCEVDRFWNEIKLKYKHREIIEDLSQGWGGIGLLFV